MRLSNIATIVFLLALGTWSGSASAQFESLIQRVPATANTLVLVNTEKALASPVATREGWRSRLREAHAAGLTVLPSDASFAVFASHLDFHLMIPMWETAIMKLDHDPDFAAFAKRTGATADQMGDYTAALLPGDAMVVNFGDRVVGAMAPANRQTVGRWIRDSSAQKGPAVSPYLKEAFGFANNVGTPIIMAIDLQDVATPEDVQAAILESDLFKQLAPVDVSKFARAIASLRGLTLGVTLNETAFGKVKVDFEQPVPLTADEAKVVVLGALKKQGVMLDELEEWTPKVNGNQITLEGTMTRSGLKRLFSLFSSPPAIKAPPPAPVKDPSPGDYVGPAAASQMYFRQVQGFLNDLRQKKSGSSTMGQAAAYYETYARKIDQLSVLNVDPDLVKFGVYAADSLRAACGALRGAAAQRYVKQVQVDPQYDTYTYGVTYGYTYRAGYLGAGYVPHGYSGSVNVYDAKATQHERTKVRAEERVGGYQKANETMQELESASSAVRKQMTTKYMVNFSDQ